MEHAHAHGQKIANAGGLLAIGTNTPLVAPGISLHTGLRASGMVTSNAEALRNVTINAARMSFVDKDLGTVEVGKIADLTIVNGDPLADLKAAADVRMVVKNGVTITLDAILAPFKTPVALAQRQEALRAYRSMCGGAKADAPGCQMMAHAD